MHVIYGIYISNKVYVGSAIDYFIRINKHQNTLTFNCHPNQHLQNAWNKCNHCTFAILEEIEDKNDLLVREAFWIEKFKSYDRKFGYNKRRIPNSNLGLKLPQTKEHIEKRINSIIGRKNTPEAIERMRNAQLGKKHSKESSLKKSLATKGRLKSEEHKNKIGKGNRKSDKWPHANGAWCKCRECLDKKNSIDRFRRKQKAINSGL